MIGVDWMSSVEMMLEQMSIGGISCLVLGVFFSVLALLFTVLKEKGAMLVSGFNTLSKSEREKYDMARLSADQRNSLMNWAMIMFAGVLVSELIHPYLAILAYAIWAALYFREVHWSPEKAFEKYKKDGR